jgi:hypothetical protein
VSTYTVTAPTGPSPVRNPGIRATLTARAEANAYAERVVVQRQASRDREITEALAAIARTIAAGDSTTDAWADLFSIRA